MGEDNERQAAMIVVLVVFRHPHTRKQPKYQVNRLWRHSFLYISDKILKGPQHLCHTIPQ